MAGVKGQVQRRGEERRRAIVDAAVELFSRGGFQGTGVAAVADKVGITAPAVLHHFGSKEHLLLAVVEEFDRRSITLGVEVFGPGGLETLRRLRRLAEGMEEYPTHSALHLRLEAESLDVESPTHRYFVERAQFMRSLVEQAIRTGQQRREIRADADPAAKAAEVIAYLDGAARSWLVDPSLSLVELFDGYLEGLVASLAAGSRGRAAVRSRPKR
jgi:AcrR family transcriptional regulator